MTLGLICVACFACGALNVWAPRTQPFTRITSKLLCCAFNTRVYSLYIFLIRTLLDLTRSTLTHQSRTHSIMVLRSLVLGYIIKATMHMVAVYRPTSFSRLFKSRVLPRARAFSLDWKFIYQSFSYSSSVYTFQYLSYHLFTVSRSRTPLYKPWT